LPKSSFLGVDSSAVIALLFVLQGGILSNAAYEGIKYSILCILSKVQAKKSSDSDVTVEININGKIDTLRFNFDLNQSQKNKIVEAALDKFLVPNNCVVGVLPVPQL